MRPYVLIGMIVVGLLAACQESGSGLKHTLKGNWYYCDEKAGGYAELHVRDSWFMMLNAFKTDGVRYEYTLRGDTLVAGMDSLSNQFQDFGNLIVANNDHIRLAYEMVNGYRDTIELMRLKETVESPIDIKAARYSDAQMKGFNQSFTQRKGAHPCNL